MSLPAPRQATYEDLLSLPAERVGEIVNGVLYSHPRPAPIHARAASRLGMRLGRSFDEGDDGPGGWWILDEPELHLLETQILVPDLAGWRLENMPELPEDTFFAVAPDWVCEVLSPSTEAHDRAEKMPIYAAAGVHHAWLLDPVLKTLEVLRHEGTHWVLLGTHQGDVAVQAEPFHEVPLQLSALWEPPAPSRSVPI